MSKNARITKRFMVVEDEDFSRFAVVHILERQGFDVISAIDGGSAIQAMINAVTHGEPIDGVITDINMLPINGLELLKAIRVGFPGVKRDLPVIMFTALKGFGLVGAAVSLDVDAFLAKPVSADQLARAIEQTKAEPKLLKTSAAYRAVSTPDFEALETIVAKLGLPSVAPAASDTSTTDGSDAEANQNDNENEDVTPATEEEVKLGQNIVGRVLSRNVATTSGEMILGSGTAISRNMVRRLAELKLIDPDFPGHIWVQVAAPESQR